MSLVNDMLNDLDERREQQPKKAVDLDWLDGNKKAVKNSRKILGIASFILTLILLAVVAWLYPVDSLQKVSPQQAQQPQSLVEANPEKLNVSEANFVQAFDVSVEDNVASINIQLEESVDYSVEKQSQQLTIIFKNTNNQLAAQDLQAVSPLSSVASYQTNDDTVIKLAVAKPFTFTDELQVDQKPTLKLTIKTEDTSAVAQQTTVVENSEKDGESINSLQSVNEPSSSQQASKENNTLREKPEKTLITIAKPTAKQRDIQVSRDAKKLIQQGKLSEAALLLEGFLSEQPMALESGVTLASMLMAEQRYAQAQMLLEKLQLSHEQHPGLRLAQARLFLAQNENAKAVDVLMAVKPDINLYADYYELLAIAARKNQQYLLSEQVYRGLVAEDPRQGNWWVGLGIALDAQAKMRESRNAYQQALASGQISESLKNYAQQRLQAL